MNVDLHDDGILWLINRVVFHPRGFALAIGSESREFSLLGDGKEVWSFSTADDDESFLAVEAMFRRAAVHRKEPIYER
jgi:hypothetical protein